MQYIYIIVFYRGEMESLGWQNWKDYLFSVFIKRSTSKIPLTSLFSLPCLESVFCFLSSQHLVSLVLFVEGCPCLPLVLLYLIHSPGLRRVCESSWGFKPLYKSYVHMLFDKWIRICGFINKTHLIQQAIFFLSWLTSCTAALYSVC